MVKFARLALLPWSAVWALANRNGWLREPPVGAAPYLNPEALGQWREAIRRSNVYLEYGSGGSTVEAARQVSHVISVETDKHYLDVVERRVRGAPESTARIHPLHVDIGWTEKWGRPLFPWATSGRVAAWRRYPAAPWLLLDELDLVPDFILVDGRFRAASVLESLLRLPNDADCLFMLDDFEGRKNEYGVVLDFANDIRPAGKSILFRRNPKFDRAACAERLEEYYSRPE